jgi:phosphoribosylformylglycinamidine cyclo-ligase
MAITYKDSGVDLEVYEQSMQRLPKLMHRTFTPRVMRNDGGFAGLFALDFSQKLFARNYKQPILVSGTDGGQETFDDRHRLGSHVCQRRALYRC